MTSSNRLKANGEEVESTLRHRTLSQGGDDLSASFGADFHVYSIQSNCRFNLAIFNSTRFSVAIDRENFVSIHVQDSPHLRNHLIEPCSRHTGFFDERTGRQETSRRIQCFKNLTDDRILRWVSS